MVQLDHFESWEFKCPCGCGGGIENMSPKHLIMLDKARDLAGIAFILNSAYRCQAYNDSLRDSVPDSPHVRGCGSDVRANNSRERFIILKAAIEVGFNRIGIAKTYIHLDNDPAKTLKVAWMY
jgi:zinc D-Ala-D-Ala carboxypeptidase